MLRLKGALKRRSDLTLQDVFRVFQYVPQLVLAEHRCCLRGLTALVESWTEIIVAL